MLTKVPETPTIMSSAPVAPGLILNPLQKKCTLKIFLEKKYTVKS